MTAVAELDGLTALRRIDPHDATLGAALSALIGATGLRIAIDSDHAASAWFRTDGIDFAVAGHPLLRSGRIDDAVALLDRIDPVLDRIERALGVSLDPADMVAAPRGDNVLIVVTGDTDTLYLAVARGHRLTDTWLEAARTQNPDAHRLPCPLRLEIAGPRLVMSDAAALAEGDLVLIGQTPRATLFGPGDAAITGHLALATGQFTHAPQGSPMATDAPASHDFAVPLSIRLPDRMTSAAALAALVPGATLPLGPLTDGMPVTLSVGERTLAQGELVQLGDRFAILIERRATIDDPVAPPPESAPAEPGDEAAQ